MLPGMCAEAVWREWEACLTGVGIMSGGCGEVVYRVWDAAWRV